MLHRAALSRILHPWTKACAIVARDVGQGLLVLSHNTLALLGLLLVTLTAVFTTQPGLLNSVEHHALAWLTERHDARQDSQPPLAAAEVEAAHRVAALSPTALPRSQTAIAEWLARRYKVAPEAVARIVQEAWLLGDRSRIDPTLILAVVAVESGFNPFAHSPMGAQGLMQVMTRVHDDKYSAYGGDRAALDPLSNLRVGVQVLRDCIQRAGGVTEGLRHYVGAANLESDGGYGARVLFEQEQLKAVASGRAPARNAAPVQRENPPEADEAASAQQVALAQP